MFLLIFDAQTLTSHWYKDKTHLTCVALIGCDIKIVQYDAFNREPLRKLKKLSFESSPSPIFFENGALNGLPNLKKLLFRNVSMVNLNYRLLQPIGIYLKSLACSKLTDTINWHNLIGGTALFKLDKISFTDLDNFVKAITPNTFTKLPAIGIISLIRCRIESIAAGSFDHLGQTLKIIYLRGNQLNTLPGNLFDCLINSLLRSTDFTENPWDRTCDLLTIVNKYNFHFEFVGGENNWPDCTNNSAETALVTDGVTLKLKCTTVNEASTFLVNVTTTMNLKMMERNGDQIVYVKSLKRRRFYLLLLWEWKNRSVVDAGGVSNDKHCVFTTAKYAEVMLRQTVATTFFACAIDSYKLFKVFPVNCISIRTKMRNLWIDGELKIYLLVSLITIYVLIFVISSICTVHFAGRTGAFNK